MMSDALAHAILPGIVGAVLLTGTKSSIVVLIGASIIGLTTSILSEFFNKKILIQPDAAIGINFTFMFAIGVIMISMFSKKIDLDPDCIMYGEIGYAPLDLLKTKSGINLGPKAVYTLFAMLIVNLLFIYLNYPKLQVTTFDAVYAKSIGIKTSLWHYLLMSFASLTIVSSFEVSGVILVVSLMIVPPAIAFLITKNIINMILIAFIFGICFALLGYYLAIFLTSSIAGGIASIAGFSLLFTILIMNIFKPTFHIVKK
jgi:manganese/zinc/iron transport system permease protein